MFKLKELRVSKESVLRAEAVDDLLERLDDMIQYAERQAKGDIESNERKYAELKEKYPDVSDDELSDYCSWEYKNWSENAGKVAVLKNLKHDFIRVFVK